MPDITVSSAVHTMMQSANAVGIRQSIGLSNLPAYQTVAAMLSSTVAAIGEGTIWRAEDFVYREAASAATDYHVITAGSVKLYAVPDAEGWITTEQLGWADDDDVSTDLARIWPTFAVGSKLLVSGLHDLGPGGKYVMPERFTLAAKRPKRDGFNFTTGNLNADGVFDAVSNCRVLGVKFTSDSVATVTGTVLRVPSTSPAKESAIIDTCLFDVPCNVGLAIKDADNWTVRNCEFTDGQAELQITGGQTWVVDSCTFRPGIYTGGDQLATVHSASSPSLHCRISDCYFIEAYGEGISVSGSLQDSIIENCHFIRCGGGSTGSNGVGSGGLDLTIVQLDSAAKREPTARLQVTACIFEDSVCRSTSDFSQGTWTSPTDTERRRWGIHGILFSNNVFRKTAAGLPCDWDVSYSSLSGDAFLGGATFLKSNQVDMVANGIIYELVSSATWVKPISCSVDFARLYRVFDDTATAEINIDGAESVTISGTFEPAETTNIFVVREDASKGTDSITFKNCTVVSSRGQSGTGAAVFAFIDGPTTNDHRLVVFDSCYFQDMDAGVLIHGDATTALVVKNCTWVDGLTSLVEYGTAGDTPVITNVYLLSNLSNGGDLETGTETSIGTKTAQNNVGFV